MTLGKLIKNNESPLPSAPGEMPEKKGGGPAVVDGGGCGGSGRAQPPKVEALACSPLGPGWLVRVVPHTC
jgi:hypothetical protein